VTGAINGGFVSITRAVCQAKTRRHRIAAPGSAGKTQNGLHSRSYAGQNAGTHRNQFNGDATGSAS